MIKAIHYEYINSRLSDPEYGKKNFKNENFHIPIIVEESEQV